MSAKHSDYERALVEMSGKLPNVLLVLRLLNKAIDSGDARAAYALGTWYLHGQNVPKNISKGTRLIKVAAKSGLSDALFDLAVSYEKGIGVKQNFQSAVRYYLAAALNGDTQAVFEVGRCYYYGLGVQSDRRIARVWLNKSSRVS